MTDIVERLRAVADMDLRTSPILAHTLDTAKEAADEIERLRNEVLRLEGSECDCPAIQQANEIERLNTYLDNQVRYYNERRQEDLAEIERLRK